MILACVGYWGVGSVFAEEPVYRNTQVVVHSGDTLWDIACRHAEGKEDVRVVMDRISRANKLQGGNIYPGQIINVPLRVQDSGLMVATK
jgi:nucleoid-associated protein YgaU